MSGLVRTEYPEEGVVVCTWPSLTNADTNGDSVQLARYGCLSVQVSGTFGTSGAVTIKGSNDGLTWYTLTDKLQDPYDPQNPPDAPDALIFSANGLKEIMQTCRFIRPEKSTSDAALDVKVVIVGRR